MAVQPAQEFWNSRYLEKDKIWSGKPNATLVNYIEDLEKGTALDLGCGEGGDAIWLAEQGWNVTATDISDVALERTTNIAKERGLSDKISCEQHDFALSFPSGEFDLVSAQFLQSPIEMDRGTILSRAAKAVAVGGTLLIAEHAAAPSWSNHHHDKFPTAQETYDSINLDETMWEIKVLGTFERHGSSPDGEPATLLDNVIKLKRNH